MSQRSRCAVWREAVQAEPLMRHALAIDERSFGPEHPAVARDLNGLAQLLQAANRLAEAERVRREVNALAQAALFTNQIPAYQAARSVYLQRAYLQTFNRAVAGSRKYIVLATNTHDVVTFNLEDKIRPDLLDVKTPGSKT